MAKIFDELKGLISPELISKASSFLGAEPAKVESGLGSIVPGLLGSLLAKGNNSGVESTLMQAAAGHGGIMSSLGSLFSGESHEQSSGIGTSFLQSILGDKLSGFVSTIASHVGISPEIAGKLTNMAAPMVAGFLGNKLKTGGLNLSGLLGSLNSEKDSFLKMIPSGLTSVLGVSSLAHLGDSLHLGANNVVGKAAHEVKDMAGKATKEAKHIVHEVENISKTKNNNWWWWVIALAVGILAILFGWRSCSNRAGEIVDTAKDKVETTTAAAVDKVEEVINNLKLPDGTILDAAKGSIEDQIVGFIKSDAYKNATEEQLKDKWFNFDRIDFVHGSATEFTPGSEVQLKNMIEILKNFKDVKIKIGCYTDKTGNAQQNMKLSQDRANTVKDYFAKAGLGSMLVGAEGYGDKFAKFAADAPESDRATDRHVSIRFAK